MDLSAELITLVTLINVRFCNTANLFVTNAVPEAIYSTLRELSVALVDTGLDLERHWLAVSHETLQLQQTYEPKTNNVYEYI